MKGVFILFAFLLQIASSLFYLALHITTPNSFPPPLTAKEETELIEKMKQGDSNAKNKLIEHNLRLVAHIIKKYYSNTSDQDDLISIGTIGLIKAVSTFKPDKKIRLATYAARCIENEVLMYFRSAKKSAADLHFSDPIDTDKDGNSLTLIDVVADDINIADEIDKKMKLEKLRVLLETRLDDREKEIIKLRYGIGGKKSLTQKEVAAILGISRSYVSRIETSVLKKLRHLL
ncbi:MAG: RNA polymerase sporulation sigma factor SigK [Clostridia bacterium]|nr:RNA polymerase sporulation sigma factor SigK [Clostridia bacterium]